MLTLCRQTLIWSSRFIINWYSLVSLASEINLHLSACVDKNYKLLHPNAGGRCIQLVSKDAWAHGGRLWGGGLPKAFVWNLIKTEEPQNIAIFWWLVSQPYYHRSAWCQAYIKIWEEGGNICSHEVDFSFSTIDRKMGHFLNDHTMLFKVHKIGCPTLVIHGQKDAMVAEEHVHFLHEVCIFSIACIFVFIKFMSSLLLNWDN